MILGLDHIGIAVSEIKSSLLLYQNILGLKLERILEAKEHKIKAALMSAGTTKIELIEPLNKDSPMRKFLEKRGEGIHHLAFKVDNLQVMLKELKGKGVKLIDEKPRVGVEGNQIAFLHPQSTKSVLIELCEAQREPI